MISSAAKSTDLRKQQKEIPSQQGNIPSSTSPKKGKKKTTSFFRPVSLIFARVFVCFLFYLNYVCQSEGQVLNRSTAQRGRAFYCLYPWGKNGTQMPAVFLRFPHKQEISGPSELPRRNVVGQCSWDFGEKCQGTVELKHCLGHHRKWTLSLCSSLPSLNLLAHSCYKYGQWFFFV